MLFIQIGEGKVFHTLTMTGGGDSSNNSTISDRMLPGGKVCTRTPVSEEEKESPFLILQVMEKRRRSLIFFVRAGNQNQKKGPAFLIQVREKGGGQRIQHCDEQVC